MNRNAKIALVALAAVLAGAGCSKDNATAPLTAPTPPANVGAALTPETQAGLQTMQAALESPAWQSLDALSLAGPGGAPVAAAVRPMLMGAAATPSAATAATSSLVRGVADALKRQAAASPQAKVIPASVLGTTYVFDPEKHCYVADPDRTGAPENGVRYILYAVNPFTHEPVVSAEIGYADLTDEGDDTPNAAALHLKAVSDDVTFVDYAVSLAGSEGAGEINVEGSFFDGTTREASSTPSRGKHLAFSIRAHGEQVAAVQSLTVRFRLGVPEDNFELTNDAHAEASNGNAVVNQSIAIGDHTFVIASAHTANTVDATVTIDGAVFAKIHADASALTVVGADGEPLSTEQRVGLWRLLGLFDHVSRVLHCLLVPVYALFALIPQA